MDRLAALALARPNWTALLLGALAALGFPPLHLWPLALLAMGAFALLLRASTNWRQALLRGWLFGVAHFTVVDNWIATAFTYQAEMPAVLGWAAVPLLSLYLAIYPALAALGGWLIGRQARLPVFAAAFGGTWIVGEWLRSWVFTGYAWGPFSLALLGDWDRPGLAMLLPWTGTYALSGIAVALGAVLVGAVAGSRLVLAAVLAMATTAGMLWPAPAEQVGTQRYTLVQPNLRQEELNDPARFERQFQSIAALSRPQAPGEQRIVLWPESAVPDYLRDGYPQRYYDQTTAGGDPAFARERIGRTIGSGSLLLTGAVDLRIGEEAGRRQANGAYNSVTAVSAEGELVGHYAKAHLVPYGEYLPLRWLLEPLGASRLVAGSIDFLPGPGPRTLDFGTWGKAGMQICYEIVFSGEVVDRGNRPDFLFNPSNDGWFGSWGPPQHLAQARMRAIEEGLPVLRSTTTGISAVIDAQGVVRQHIGRGEAARRDGTIPLARAATLFAQLAHGLTLGWAALFLLASAIAKRSRHGYRHGNT